MADPTVPTLNIDSLGPSAQAGLCVQRHANHGNTAAHDHVFHEIVYIEAGSVEHETAAGRQRLRPGDVIVLRPYVWHAYHDARRLTLINCLFDGRLIRRFDDLLRAVPGSFDLYRRRERRPRSEAPIVLHCRPAQRPALLRRLDAIMAEREAGEPGWELAATTGLLDVLLIVARLWGRVWSPPQVELPARTEQALFDTVIYLEDHYTELVDLEYLARRVKLSRWHLSRSFSRRMGMGVIEYIHRLRIEEACRRLRLGNEPIGRIAMELGYGEIAYFTRRFRSLMGQSPRQYRADRRGQAPHAMVEY